MREYDYFVIYGELLGAHDCFRYERNLSRDDYSTQVRKATVQDHAASFMSVKISAALRAITAKPIFILSANVHLEDPTTGSEADRGEGAALLAAAVAPAIYLPFPPTLFRDDRPDSKYYLGSLNVLGVEPDREAMPTHHHIHLNQQGGDLVLAHIVEAIENL